MSLFQKKRLYSKKTAEAINEIVSGWVAPYLKDRGYKKNGRTWSKECRDYSFIINLQTNRWDSQDNGASFVINYGVFVPYLHSVLLEDVPTPKTPKEYDCTIQRRIDNRIGANIWWNIYDSTDMDELGTEVCRQLEAQCLTYFASIGSLGDIAEQLQHSGTGSVGAYLDGAVLNAHLNNPVAKQLFKKEFAHADKNNPEFQSKVKKLAEKFGYEV
ncbi:DUF4304 domain-containing protein [Candidatus Saccharibacteria bacterium]|nr:MAG: DUF4304 domain-containing protein [Candidatus Saccharibacteria bacterium]